MKLKRILGVVFTNENDKRYIPRAIPGRAPGSLGWNVWDQREGMFLSDKEVRKIDPHEPLALN